MKNYYDIFLAFALKSIYDFWTIVHVKEELDFFYIAQKVEIESMFENGNVVGGKQLH